MTLQRILDKCAPQSRSLEPVILWLSLVPLVGFVTCFLVVFGMARTLRSEFTLRGLHLTEPEPGKGVGLAACICWCCSWLPLVGFAHLALWIVYWVKMAEYSRMLDGQPQMIQPTRAF